jgi:hypothetical protein
MHFCPDCSSSTFRDLLTTLINRGNDVFDDQHEDTLCKCLEQQHKLSYQECNAVLQLLAARWRVTSSERQALLRCENHQSWKQVQFPIDKIAQAPNLYFYHKISLSLTGKAILHLPISCFCISPYSG